MKVQSKVDPETYYMVNSQYVRMVRNGDSLTIPHFQIPEQAKRFKPEIQAELLGFWDEKYPERPCKVCGKPFRASYKFVYCSPECQAICKKETQRAYEESKRQPRVCQYCGKIFNEGTGRKYCSQECRVAVTTSKQREAIAKKKKTKRKSQLDEKVKLAAELGISYGELQKRETLKQIGRVVV